MRFLSYLTALLVAVLLAACGGGGGSSGANPNRPTIFTTAPSELSLPIGAVRQYEIRGGVAPYTVSTANPRVVKTAFSGEVFTLNTVGQGGTTVNVMDNNGATVSINVTVGDPLKLSMDSIKSYVGDKITVFITGGTPPYRASSLDVGVGATVNGSDLLLDLRALSEIDVSVIDAQNQSAKVKVEVIAGSPIFSLVPAAQTISENSTQPIFLKVLGGVGKLSVQSSDTTLLRASISGNIVTVTTGANAQRCVPEDTKVIITVDDSRGGFAISTINLTNNPSGCGLRISANPVVVIAGNSAGLILDGISDTGTISISSSDPSKATATYSNGVVTVTGVSSTWVAETPVVAASPAGCGGAAPAPICTIPEKPYVAARDVPVRMTVIDSGPPTRSVTFDVTVP